MFPLWIVMVGALFIAIVSSSTVPAELHNKSVLIADVTATNFVAYRAAVIDYKNNNPGATGTIADTSLTFLPGYIRDGRWTNLIQSNTLYVYSTSTVETQAKTMIFTKNGNSLSVGTKSAASHLISPYGEDTGIVLPASIPQGVITIVGD